MRRMAITMLGGALALVGAAACDSDSIGENIAEEAVEQAGGGDVDIETGGDVPDCFPDDAPVPDGQVQGGFGVGEGDEAICTFLVDVDGDIGEATDAYKSALEDDGWDIGFEAQSPDGEAFGASKGDVGLLISGGDASGVTSISITAGPADIAATEPPEGTVPE